MGSHDFWSPPCTHVCRGTQAESDSDWCSTSCNALTPLCPADRCNCTSDGKNVGATITGWKALPSDENQMKAYWLNMVLSQLEFQPLVDSNTMRVESSPTAETGWLIMPCCWLASLKSTGSLRIPGTPTGVRMVTCVLSLGPISAISPMNLPLLLLTLQELSCKNHSASASEA